MARKMLLAGVSEEELQRPEAPQKPQTPKGKWENFWYYYKWWVLGGLGVALILTVCIVQMVTKVEPDYEIVLVTGDAVDYEAQDKLYDAFLEHAVDVNGDGEVRVGLENLPIGADEDDFSEMTYTYTTKLQALMGAGYNKFYIFDQPTYERVIKKSVDEGYPFYIPMDIEAEGYVESHDYWDWYGSEYQQSEWGKKFPEHLYFGVCGPTKKGSEKRQEADKQTIEACMALAKAFIEAQQP